MSKSIPLFVFGAQKTGTSTMVGILNCHPRIFIAHEWFVDRKLSKHGLLLFRHYCVPQRERINKRKSIRNAIKKLDRTASKSGFEYDYVGDKWPVLGAKHQMDRRLNMIDVNNSKLIFMVRDVRTWLGHKVIPAIYKLYKNDAMQLVYLYVYYFVKSFTVKNCLRVRMEDMISCPCDTVDMVSKFLGTDPNYMYSWWDKVGKYEDKSKNIHRWWDRHLSATIKPSVQDVKVELSDVDMWDRILPIFDKYYNGYNKEFSRSEVNNDLKKLKKIQSTEQKIRIEQCFKNIDVTKLYEKPSPADLEEVGTNE